MKAGEVIAKMIYFVSKIKHFLRKVRAPIWSDLLGNSQCGQPWG